MGYTNSTVTRYGLPGAGPYNNMQQYICIFLNLHITDCSQMTFVLGMQIQYNAYVPLLALQL